MQRELLSIAAAGFLAMPLAATAGGGLLQLVAFGAQDLYLPHFSVQFNDGLTGAADGKLAFDEIVPGSFSGVSDTSMEASFSTIVNVPNTSATVCQSPCTDGTHWQFGGSSSNGGNSTLVESAAAFTYSTSDVAPIPEASTFALMAAGLAALGFVARRRKH